MTLVVRPESDAAPFWHADVWRKIGATLVCEPFVGATCFEKADLQLVDVEPEAPQYVARRPKGLKQPGEPTLTERLEHELTHLPVKPWCEICVRAKSKQAKSCRLSLKQPVLQMDFSFLGDKPGEEQIKILNVVDVLTPMALSVVIPTKARTPYSQAELHRFVLETGRTFGKLQCDPEPVLRALATSVTGESVDFPFVRPQLDGSRHKAASVTCRPLCMDRSRLCVLRFLSATTLTFRCTLHFSLVWCVMRSGL